VRRGEASRLRWALAASVVVHAAGGALFWLATTQVEEMPAMRVYAVDIVSPPPQLEGEPNPGGGGTPEPVEETPEPEPQPETPPAQPEPAPPAPEKPAQREPSPPTPATRTPQAERPAPARTQPAEEEEEEEEEERPTRTAGGGSGEGTGASRGRDADPTSAGGENIDEHLRGVQCPSPAYCANIVRQLYRYFRPPTGSTNDAVEVFFWINRDGSAAEMRVVRSTGSYRFQLAALEAVEQAGNNKAFGALPRAFQLDRLPVSFYFRPAR
jgi:TonB family protein